MKKRRSSLRYTASVRSARLQRTVSENRWFRVLGGRAMATLAVGAALSVGGINEAMHDVHFLVRKDLDAVRVVKEEGKSAQVVAKVEDGFAANSLFKLSRVLPNSLVTRQIALFDDRWIPADPEKAPTGQPGLFRQELKRINEAIHRDFFANAVPFGDIIHEKARKYDVDPALVAAVIETESRFHPQARSRVGARGLMQLMPRTGRWMGARNLNDPEQNVDAGVKYLKYLQERFDGDLKKAIAAYNAGEGNVKRYDGVPPFRETRQYVNKVMTRKKKYETQTPTAGGAAVPDGVMTLR